MKTLLLLLSLTVVITSAKAQTAAEHMQSGIDFYKQKLYEDAVAELNEAIAMDSTLHQAYFYRALSTGNLGGFGQAIPDLTKATNLAPKHDEYWVYLGMAYDLGYKDKASALICYDNALTVNPNSPEAYFRRGLTYYAMLEDPKACADLAKAAELGHEQAPAYKAKFCK